MKLILVASALGRVGTSAMSGLLNLNGFEVGRRPTPGNIHNKKGYFELRKFNEFYCSVYGKYYSDDLLAIPSIKKVNSLAKRHAKAFERLFDSEFTTDKIVFKSQRFLNVPLLLNSKYCGSDIRVIHMIRNPVNQARSIININGKMSYSVNSLVKIINKWINFSDKIKSHYKLNCISIRFEDFVSNKSIVERVSDFVGCKIDARSWIDEGMVTYK